MPGRAALGVVIWVAVAVDDVLAEVRRSLDLLRRSHAIRSVRQESVLDWVLAGVEAGQSLARLPHEVVVAAATAVSRAVGFAREVPEPFHHHVEGGFDNKGVGPVPDFVTIGLAVTVSVGDERVSFPEFAPVSPIVRHRRCRPAGDR